MTTSWELGLSIDARGHDDSQVAVVPGVKPSPAHIKVRIGSVLVHILDGAAAMSAARAWAAARLEAEDWRPSLLEPLRQAQPNGAGVAYPVASIVFEGRQQWQVRRAGHALEVTVGPLVVRTHDVTALDTHVRAWTEASAVAARVFPGKMVPFGQLVEHQRVQAFRALDAAARQPAQRRRSRSLPPAPPGPAQGRDRD